MLTGHRSAWRRRRQSSRAMRIAVLLAIPTALGVALGIVIAVKGGNASHINQSALAGSASPSASASASQPAAAAAANVSCDLIVPANALTAHGPATPLQLTRPNGNDPQS